jgi:hypothetical protein
VGVYHDVIIAEVVEGMNGVFKFVIEKINDGRWTEDGD